jgi:hypothetical protein
MKLCIRNNGPKQLLPVLGVFGFAETWLDNEGAIIE